MPTATQKTTEPAKPSHDFLGEITGAIGCLPNRTPAQNPPMSEAAVTAMKVRMPLTPASYRVKSVAPPSRSIRATNEPRNGT